MVVMVKWTKDCGLTLLEDFDYFGIARARRVSNSRRDWLVET